VTRNVDLPLGYASCDVGRMAAHNAFTAIVLVRAQTRPARRRATPGTKTSVDAAPDVVLGRRHAGAERRRHRVRGAKPTAVLREDGSCFPPSARAFGDRDGCAPRECSSRHSRALAGREREDARTTSTRAQQRLQYGELRVCSGQRASTRMQRQARPPAKNGAACLPRPSAAGEELRRRRGSACGKQPGATETSPGKRRARVVRMRYGLSARAAVVCAPWRFRRPVRSIPNTVAKRQEAA